MVLGMKTCVRFSHTSTDICHKTECSFQHCYPGVNQNLKLQTKVGAKIPNIKYYENLYRVCCYCTRVDKRKWGEVQRRTFVNLRYERTKNRAP